jgi:hypothetical protein
MVEELVGKHVRVVDGNRIITGVLDIEEDEQYPDDPIYFVRHGKTTVMFGECIIRTPEIVPDLIVANACWAVQPGRKSDEK